MGAFENIRISDVYLSREKHTFENYYVIRDLSMFFLNFWFNFAHLLFFIPYEEIFSFFSMWKYLYVCTWKSCNSQQLFNGPASKPAHSFRQFLFQGNVLLLDGATRLHPAANDGCVHRSAVFNNAANGTFSSEFVQPHEHNPRT